MNDFFNKFGYCLDFTHLLNIQLCVCLHDDCKRLLLQEFNNAKIEYQQENSILEVSQEHQKLKDYLYKQNDKFYEYYLSLL